MRIAILILFFFMYQVACAQHIVDFTIQNQVCQGEYLNIIQNSDPAIAFQWDFCADQLEGIYTGASRSPVVGSMTDITLVQDNGEWFGFATSRSNQLMRLNFGDSPSNTYTITTLGNPGGILLSPEGIAIVKEGDQWVGLVTLLAEHEVVRLSWGNDIRSAPTAQSLNLKSLNKLNNPIQISVEKDGNNTVAAIVNTTGNTVTLINFGSSVFNNPQASDIIVSSPFTGAVNMQGVTISKQCDAWFLYTISQNKVFRVSVGSALFSSISAAQIQDFSPSVPVAIGDFGKIASIDYGGNTFVYLASYTNPDLLALKWPNQNASPEFIDLSDTFIPPNPFSIETFNHGGNFGLFIGGFGGGLSHVNISKPCLATQRFSTASDPTGTFFTGSGVSAISLTVTFPDGTKCAITKEVTTTSYLAPSPAIQKSAAICVNTPITFTAQNINTEIVNNWSWDFQDGTSIQQADNFSFSLPGMKTISLTATGANGCTNTISTNLTIYNPPLPSFTAPTGLICTNNTIAIVNTTPDNFNGNLNFQWLIDDNQVSTNRDLDYKFSTTGTPSVELVTMIPGCTTRVSQTLPEIFEGPEIAFAFVGKCEGDIVSFNSAINGEFTDVVWDFGDGGSSENLNPTHVYGPGTFSASLVVSSPNGCNNSETRLVQIKTKPSPDFTVEGPPTSCSGYESKFTDLTPSLIDGEFESWYWNFSDGEINAAKNPEHVFKNAGVFEVELTVATGDGCSGSTIKPITILQSPIVAIQSSPTCVGKQSTFTASGSDGIEFYWEIGTSYYETQNAVHTFSSPGNYSVNLNVLGSNQCVTKLTNNITVLPPITPSFSAVNNCKGFQTNFVSTVTGEDAVITRLWDFAGQGTSTETNPSFTFPSTGNKNVSLQVTTESGCVYQGQQVVNVIEPPEPDFSFSPDFGVPPQEISFTNLSSNASTYNWNFDDGTSSTQQSPKHVFATLGDFDVELRATNSAGCETSVSKVVSMVAPLPDVDLSLMTLTTNPDGTLKIIVTIANKGNTIVKNLPVRLDVSGQITLETLVTESITPFSMYNLVLNYSIAQNRNLQFLCASATLEGDLNPDGNRICNQLKSEVAIITPYPNPTSDLLMVEWVAQGGEEVELTLVDTRGQSVLRNTDISSPGLNQKTLDVRNVRSGIYLLRILTPNNSQTHRILVSN